jgi:O-methyltransferase involved in polyketide biosynthesis
MKRVNPMNDVSATGLEPPPFDVTVPHVARIYDYLLNGKDNYAADRAAAARLLEQIPHAAGACLQNRDFLGRVVRRLAARGIRQFLDIGSGLPAVENVHEVAKKASPACRVVYVDNDRVVCAHARAMLASTADGVEVVQGDVRDPAGIIAAAKEHLDFNEPAAVLMFAVLHFLTAGDDPHAIVRALAAPLAPGSAIAVSHITADATDPARSQAAQQVYRGASAPAVPRGLAEIERFFTGLALLPPGVADIRAWGLRKPEPGAPLTFYGGVALVPGEERQRL